MNTRVVKISHDENLFMKYDQRAKDVQKTGEMLMELKPELRPVEMIKRYIKDAIEVKDQLMKGYAIYHLGSKKENDPKLKTRIVQLLQKIMSTTSELCVHVNIAFKALKGHVDRNIHIRFQFTLAQLRVDDIDHSKFYPHNLESVEHPYHARFKSIDKFCKSAMKEPKSALRDEIEKFQSEFRAKMPEKQQQEQKTPTRKRNAEAPLVSEYSSDSTHSTSSSSSSSSTSRTLSSLVRPPLKRQLFTIEPDHKGMELSEQERAKQLNNQLYNVTQTPTPSLPSQLYCSIPSSLEAEEVLTQPVDEHLFENTQSFGSSH